ncbi:MAG TPA: heme o synthase, partial [candidate division Zixibacteria bacterium]|nr:heme o synthase [candidate division Zixibacteria bacterium]
ATALTLEGSLLSDPFLFFAALLGLYLAGGSANALNQCFERNIDAQMTRTSSRRPLPQGRLGVGEAFVFSVSIGLAGVALFAIFFNLLSAALALATILFYSLFYTLYLKPTTDQNIVIGGAAGAMAPIIAWAAASGAITLAPIVMFAIVFLWTPPHFWALALFCSEDYQRVNLPMLPVSRGAETTYRWILYYTLAVVVVSLTLLIAGAGWAYLAAAVGLGGMMIRRAQLARRERSVVAHRGLFGFSIVYLFALFVAMMVDAALLRL